MSSDPSNIFVVDDDPAILHSMRFLLESEGHRVEAFASGDAVLQAFPGPSPAFVILDQVMPGMDGLEVFRRLRASGLATPAVLMTGHPDPGIRARARDAGLPLIEKPLALDAFMTMLAAGEAEPRSREGPTD